jgi:hypothetical protein
MTILKITLLPVFYLIHDVSETRFCLRLQVETTQMGLIEKDSLYLQAQAISPIGWCINIRCKVLMTKDRVMKRVRLD